MLTSESTVFVRETGKVESTANANAQAYATATNAISTAVSNAVAQVTVPGASHVVCVLMSTSREYSEEDCRTHCFAEWCPIYIQLPSVSVI